MNQPRMIDFVREAFASLLAEYVETPDLASYIVTPSLGDHAGIIGGLILAHRTL